MGGRALAGARLLARKAAKEGAFPSQIKLQASGTCLERLRMPIYSTYNISQDAATWPLPAHLREIRMQLYSLSSCATPYRRGRKIGLLIISVKRFLKGERPASKAQSWEASASHMLISRAYATSAAGRGGVQRRDGGRLGPAAASGDGPSSTWPSRAVRAVRLAMDRARLEAAARV